MLTVEQRVKIVKLHYENGGFYSITMRKFRTEFRHHNAPGRSTVVDLIKKFERTGQVMDIKHKTCQPRVITPKNIEMVTNSVESAPKLSIRRCSQQIGISRTSLQLILTKKLGLWAYKI